MGDSSQSQSQTSTNWEYSDQSLFEARVSGGMSQILRISDVTLALPASQPRQLNYWNEPGAQAQSQQQPLATVNLINQGYDPEQVGGIVSSVTGGLEHLAGELGTIAKATTAAQTGAERLVERLAVPIVLLIGLAILVPSLLGKARA
jgi:hypothetical protein